MPTLVLKPFAEIYITVEQEQAILDFMQTDEQIMTVSKTTFHRSAFAYIKPGGYSAVDAEALQQIRAKSAARRVGSGDATPIAKIVNGRKEVE